MSLDLKQSVFAINCANGHTLQGWVSFCPFCGDAVTQPVSEAPGLAPPAVEPRAKETPAPPAVEPRAKETPAPPAVEPRAKETPAPPAVEIPTVVKVAEAQDPIRPKIPSLPPPQPIETPASKSHIGKYLAITLAVGITGIYLGTRPNQQDVTCSAFLTDATAQFTAGNISAARSITTQAISTCSGDVRSRAAELQASLDKAASTKTGCEKALRVISSQIADRRLTSARNGLDQLDSACIETGIAKDLGRKVVESQTISTAIQTEVRNLLAQGDARGAKASVDQLAAQNREYSELAALKAEIQAALKVSETPISASPQAVQQPRPITSPVPQAQPDLAQAFLRDAEQSLSQQKFDAAKTFVESARRVDPTNAQAAVLWRRIKERELQYLKDETTIK